MDRLEKGNPPVVSQGVLAKLVARFGQDGFALVEDKGDPYITAPAASVREVMAFLRDDPELRFDQLLIVTGVDYADHIDVLYHLRSYSNPATIAIKVTVARDGGSLPSIADIHPAADWHERETFDMLGVRFERHPNLRRILLPEDWDGHPLRKDYKQPEEYHGIANS